ncbi:RrF2 family transcriptional regulator [Treponema zioleckii]|uniref:RrF2 family transcriptional regulator n=1 Tax=Treponema zioleckii TaxID=331680 RepID=UPI00168AD7C9|nr:Rrf2 family transcriptional regulator [Treponema zioleckii]
MKISTRGRYALRFMIDLAQHNNGDYIALKDISSRQNISIKYLEQITSLLSKFGFLLSTRGPKGGYKLAKAPDAYKVGDVLRITEGSLAPVACLETEKNICERYGECKTIALWEGLYKVINNYLDSITIDDLLNKAEPGSFVYMI